MQDRPDAAAPSPNPDGSKTAVGPTIAEAYRILPGDLGSRVLLLCDHANNAFPPGYGTLGLPADQLVRHIAYDIGAAEVTRRLSEQLNAPAAMTHYSRLLIDPNRGTDDPTLIMRISDGAVVPGNRKLAKEEREKRQQQFYDPYHDAIAKLLDDAMAADEIPLIVSIHSFTDNWRGTIRPWHAGILWDQDGRLAVPMLEGLRAAHDLVVGDNEPYTGRLKGDSMWRHGTMRGLAHCIVEIRQDLIRAEDGQQAWADRLGDILRGLIADEEFRKKALRVEFHVSNDDITETGC